MLIIMTDYLNIGSILTEYLHKVCKGFRYLYNTSSIYTK